jgi:hypothetical protein
MTLLLIPTDIPGCKIVYISNAIELPELPELTIHASPKNQSYEKNETLPVIMHVCLAVYPM